jgi:hypothetical protein
MSIFGKKGIDKKIEQLLETDLDWMEDGCTEEIMELEELIEQVYSRLFNKDGERFT